MYNYVVTRIPSGSDMEETMIKLIASDIDGTLVRESSHEPL